MFKPFFVARGGRFGPVFFTLLLVFVMSDPAHAGFKDDFAWGGYLKNETAYRISEPRSFTKIRNILDLNAKYKISKNYWLTASGWYYYDLVYDLFDYRTIAARSVRESQQPLSFFENLLQEKDSNILELREFYLDASFKNLDIRAGRQFVVWGVLTGVRIVDEVQPMNFRELILPDLLDYRIPLWMVKADYYGENNQYELLWIPDIRFHKAAPRGSEWELLQDIRDTNGNLLVNFPNSQPKNWEWGLKVSRAIGENEISLSYFYTWDDFPVNFRLSPYPAQVGSPDPIFFPTYTRIQMFGGTLQRPFFGQVLKGEITYVTGKYFGIGEVDANGDGYLDSLGELKRDHLRWGLAIDFNVLKTDVSVGVAQWIIFGYNPAMVMDNFDTSINVFLRKELVDQNAVFTLLDIWLINLNENYLKPKITFKMTDYFQVAVGMDLFWGKKSQLGVAFSGGRPTDLVEVPQRSQFIGNFQANNRLFVEFKYSF